MYSPAGVVICTGIGAGLCGLAYLGYTSYKYFKKNNYHLTSNNLSRISTVSSISPKLNEVEFSIPSNYRVLCYRHNTYYFYSYALLNDAISKWNDLGIELVKVIAEYSNDNQEYTVLNSYSSSESTLQQYQKILKIMNAKAVCVDELNRILDYEGKEEEGEENLKYKTLWVIDRDEATKFDNLANAKWKVQIG